MTLHVTNLLGHFGELEFSVFILVKNLKLKKKKNVRMLQWQEHMAHWIYVNMCVKVSNYFQGFMNREIHLYFSNKLHATDVDADVDWNYGLLLVFKHS